jgi:FAD-dependent monooxygenase
VTDAAIRALYDANIILVRPDGHVSWRGHSTPRDPDAVAAMATGHLARAGRP